MSLPGTRKLVTECALEVGQYALNLRAFVARRPDENHAEVFRWLLERNLKLYGVAFALDALGDIYLTGKLALAGVTPGEVDRLLGVVADTADSSFNAIVALGLRREHPPRMGLATLPGGVDRESRGLPASRLRPGRPA